MGARCDQGTMLLLVLDYSKIKGCIMARMGRSTDGASGSLGSKPGLSTMEGMYNGRSASQKAWVKILQLHHLLSM